MTEKWRSRVRHWLLVAFALLFALTAAFPPWTDHIRIEAEGRAVNFELRLGFYPLLAPPRPHWDGGVMHRAHVYVATDQLLLEWAVLGVLGAAAGLCLRRSGGL